MAPSPTPQITKKEMGLRHDLLRAPCVLSLPEYTIGRSVTERELIYGKTSRHVIRTGFPNVQWFALSVRHQLERKSAATLNPGDVSTDPRLLNGHSRDPLSQARHSQPVINGHPHPHSTHLVTHPLAARRSGTKGGPVNISAQFSSSLGWA
jgi:hypothetical protein